MTWTIATGPLVSPGVLALTVPAVTESMRTVTPESKTTGFENVDCCSGTDAGVCGLPVGPTVCTGAGIIVPFTCGAASTGVHADIDPGALVDDDVLFLKSDEETRQDFLSRGSARWSPPGMEPTFGYLSCPDEVLEDPEELAIWIRRACEVALRKKAAPKRRKKAASPDNQRG